LADRGRGAGGGKADRRRRQPAAADAGGGLVLTGKLIRVRYARDRVLPQYLDASDPTWLAVAERLLDVFRTQDERTRGELEAELREVFGTDPSQLIHQGLAKLLEDRCEFAVVSGQPPEQIREAVFRAATAHRLKVPSPARIPFERTAVLGEVADTLGLSPQAIEQGLFADLKSEQRSVRFKDITAERLLQRYNVALAQAVLLRSTRVEVVIRGEAPPRYRQLFRWVKFHRLVCQVEPAGPDGYQLH